MKKLGWILLGILTMLVWAGVCYAEGNNSISIVVSGDSDFYSTTQQCAQDYLRQQGFETSLPDSAHGATVKITSKKDSEPTISWDEWKFLCGKKHITLHRDTVSITAHFYRDQENYPFKSGFATRRVGWQIIEYYSIDNDHYATDNQQYLLQGGAKEATVDALSQIIKFIPKLIEAQSLQNNVYIEDNQNQKSSDIISFIETQKYNNSLSYYIIVKDGNITVILYQKDVSKIFYRKGVGQSVEQAFQNALKVERKILPQKR